MQKRWNIGIIMIVPKIVTQMHLLVNVGLQGMFPRYTKPVMSSAHHVNRA